MDDSTRTQWIESTYLQDEWKIQSALTVNYGVRFDRFTAYTSASQASPRVNIVWAVLPGTTVHTGYSRYLSPPPFELIGSKDIAMFQNTTAPPASPGADAPLPEKANYYDFGVQQKISRAFTVGIDAYYKQSHNLIDEGQFGAPIILTPFNYAYGKQYGVEFTANYTTRDLTIYLNLAAQSAKGKAIDSAQFNFAPEDLAYIAHDYIHLDHEQQKLLQAEYRISGMTRVLARTFYWGPVCARTLIYPRARSLPMEARVSRTEPTCRTTRRSTWD